MAKCDERWHLDCCGCPDEVKPKDCGATGCMHYDGKCKIGFHWLPGQSCRAYIPKDAKKYTNCEDCHSCSIKEKFSGIVGCAKPEKNKKKYPLKLSIETEICEIGASRVATTNPDSKMKGFQSCANCDAGCELKKRFPNIAGCNEPKKQTDCKVNWLPGQSCSSFESIKHHPNLSSRRKEILDWLNKNVSVIDLGGGCWTPDFHFHKSPSNPFVDLGFVYYGLTRKEEYKSIDYRIGVYVENDFGALAFAYTNCFGWSHVIGSDDIKIKPECCFPHHQLRWSSSHGSRYDLSNPMPSPLLNEKDRPPYPCRDCARSDQVNGKRIGKCGFSVCAWNPVTLAGGKYIGGGKENYFKPVPRVNYGEMVNWLNKYISVENEQDDRWRLIQKSIPEGDDVLPDNFHILYFTTDGHRYVVVVEITDGYGTFVYGYDPDLKSWRQAGGCSTIVGMASNYIKCHLTMTWVTGGYETPPECPPKQSKLEILITIMLMMAHQNRR